MKLKKLMLGIWGAAMTFLLVVLILPLAVGIFAPNAANSQATSQYFWTAYVRTLLHVYGHEVVIDSLRSQGPFILNNKLITSGTCFAKIDSFLTTAALDTTVMSGATIGDVFFVGRYLPSWSSTPDTGAGQYAAYWLNTDSVVVSRTALTPASTLKSGALYTIQKIDR
jgi:hypothetical protein